LKDDGVFIFSDFRYMDQYQNLDDILNEEFDVIKCEDIRRNVLHSLQL